jgi:hypothetical protein
MKFNFHFGKKKSTATKLIIVGITLTTIITTLSQCTGVKEEKIWDLVDEVQRQLPSNIVRDIILLDPQKIERRVIRDIDKAIADYERLTGDDGTVRMLPPRYSELPVDDRVCYTRECKSLGGEMRLTAPWYVSQ